MEGDGRQCLFYKGPSADSLFSSCKEEDDDDLIFSSARDTSKSNDTSTLDQKKQFSLFDDTSSIFEDHPSKSISNRSSLPSTLDQKQFSLFDDTSSIFENHLSKSISNRSSSPSLPQTNRIPWFKSAQTWKQWVSVLLSVPTPSPLTISETLPLSSSQIVKDIIRETLHFTSTNTFLHIPSTVSSIQELDTHLLLHTKSKSVLKFWKRATSRTSSGHESLCAVMSYLKSITKADDFLLRAISDPKCTQVDEKRVVMHNDFQVFKRSFHGDFSVTLSPRLVASCQTVHCLLDNDDDDDDDNDDDKIVSTLQIVFKSSHCVEKEEVKKESSSSPPPAPPPARPTTPTESISSILMGSADLAYTYIKNQTRKRETMFFSLGFGNMSSFRRVRTSLIKEWKRDRFESYFSSHPLTLEWSHETGPPPGVRQTYHHSFLSSNDSNVSSQHKIRDTNVYDATFLSPLRLELPPNVKLGHIRLILPPVQKLRGLVLLTAATGEETYVGRERRFAKPLSKHGIGVLLLTVPFYGTRRPRGQVACYIRTVSEYMLQSLTTLLEGVSLLRWCRETFKSTPLLVSGLSWGGGTSASIAIACRDLERFACVPILGSTSPRAMVEGVRMAFECILFVFSYTPHHLKRNIKTRFKSDIKDTTHTHTRTHTHTHTRTQVLRLSVNWNALDENKDTAREKLERAFELLALETFLEEDETEDVKKIPYVCVLNALSDYYVTAKEGKSNLVVWCSRDVTQNSQRYKYRSTNV